MSRVFKNESAESIVARELLEAVWYDNGGLYNRQGQFTKFKKRLQRILKKLPPHVFELFTIEKYEEFYDSEPQSFIDQFAIGEFNVKKQIIEKYPELKKVDELLDEWFDGED